MKKSIIALAVAGAMTAPMVAQADATLYGSFRMGVAATDNNGPDGSKTDGDIDVIDTSSRMGVKGDIDLGLQDTKGLFRWEAQVIGTDDPDQTDTLRARLLYIGAKGDWGQATIGKQYMPHYLLISAPTNVFNPGSSGYGERFNLGNGAIGKSSGHFLKRTEGSLAYASPKMGGFQFIGGVALLGDNDDGDDSNDKSIDIYNVAATYSANGVTVSASVGGMENQDTTGAIGAVGDSLETDIWGLAAKYKVNGFEIMAKYEDEESEVASSKVAEESVWELAARYTVGATSFYGRFSDYEEDVSDTDLQQWGLGIQQKLGRGRVYLEHVNNDSEDTIGDRTVAGYRVDF